ncbi:MAG: AmmeMemoRadiSam system radical SAM enzyme [Desulfomonilia bacterium]|nr:AmmeMemoRadiSam system radical SAM enzyme [Desulfomonilia bacterium]
MQHEAMFYERRGDSTVQCGLCHHTCRISDGSFGLCGVRQNVDGTLYTRVYGQSVSSNVDPVEKKPLYHFLPGTDAFSIATLGCNFRCDFCQNWKIAQEFNHDDEHLPGIFLPPELVVTNALECKCSSIAYTYTEPTIFFEYAYDTARLAREQGLFNIFVTNGYMTPEALETVRPFLDACNVDLKSFSDEFYRTICKARLEPVLDMIRRIHHSGIWIEVITLVIPGGNDTNEELSAIARFIADIDPSIPWHISRFHPAYKVRSTPATPYETLKKAHEIGKTQGLRFVYLGNVPGASSDILCPTCSRALITKAPDYSIQEYLLEDSRCPFCSEEIEGVFQTS